MNYPTKPVRLVVGDAAGSMSGTAASLLATPLSEMWNQQVVIENRPGNIPAAEITAKATPDGHTFQYRHPMWRPIRDETGP